MSALILAAIVLALPPASSAASTAPAMSGTEISAHPQRTLAEWRSAVHQALKGQAGAKEADQPAAVMKLVQLYRELAAAPPLNSGEEKRLRTLVRARLVRLREELPLDVQKRLARVKAAEERAARLEQPQLLDRVKEDKIVLAQWKGVLAQMAGVQAGAIGGGANRDDDGQELVDLIQAVITPDFWDVNGGPGAIVYYQGLHAMVVRATTEKHEEIAALLAALRRAGN